jgi:hypothetical protein
MGGAESVGAMAADTMKLTADDVQTLVIPDTGHWLAEQAPEEMVAALTRSWPRTATGRPRGTTPGRMVSWTSRRSGRIQASAEALSSRLGQISPLPVNP